MALQKLSKAQLQTTLTRDERVDGLLRSRPALTSRADFVREITSQWSDAQERFLQIGYYLAQAAKTLPHGDYHQMIERDLPFHHSTARQLRAVWDAVDSNRISRDRLPSSYSTAYQLVTLRPEEFAALEDRQLLRPDLTRAEIVRLKKELRQTRPADPDVADAGEQSDSRSAGAPLATQAVSGAVDPELAGLSLAALLQQRDQLRAKLARIEQQIATVSAAG